MFQIEATAQCIRLLELLHVTFFVFQIKATAQCVGSASRTTDLKGLVVQWPALLPASSLCV